MIFDDEVVKGISALVNSETAPCQILGEAVSTLKQAREYCERDELLLTAVAGLLSRILQRGRIRLDSTYEMV